MVIVDTLIIVRCKVTIIFSPRLVHGENTSLIGLAAGAFGAKAPVNSPLSRGKRPDVVVTGELQGSIPA